MNYLPYYVQPRMDKNASRFSRKAILKGKQGKCSESLGGCREGEKQQSKVKVGGGGWYERIAVTVRLRLSCYQVINLFRIS